MPNYPRGLGPDSFRDAVRAPFVGTWAESSGDSRSSIGCVLRWARPGTRGRRAPSGHAHRPFKSSWIVWGVRFGGISFILDAETEHERGPVVMAEDTQLKYVGMVAAAIGGVVLFLGLVGIIINF